MERFIHLDIHNTVCYEKSAQGIQRLSRYTRRTKILAKNESYRARNLACMLAS